MSDARPSAAAAALRRLGLDDNPLRRHSDRLQTRARLIIGALFLLGCVVAALVGRAAYGQETFAAERDARTGYQATGRVVSTSTSTADPQTGATQRVVRVAWRDGDGRAHRQHLVLPIGRKVTSSLDVWVDSRGRASLSRPPESRTVASGIGAAMLFLFTQTLVLWSVYGLVVVVLNRRRSRAWQREWRLVEPEWRRRVL